MRTIRCVTRKWPDSPHWEFDARWLGADSVGTWLGVREGTWLSRPQAGFHASCDHVVLVPHDDWWLATFYDDDARRPVDTYVDITTPATWTDDTITCVDLDLDVVRRVDGSVFVDDEDEFDEHQRSLAYPSDVVRSARASAQVVLSGVEADEGPFHRGAARRWISKLRAGE
ncbi:MAG: hypothetical protein NVSMB48_23980 [Marmoricola sp.]